MSKIEVDKVIPQSGTTLTIGDSGDTTNIVGTLQNNGAALTGDITSVVAGTNLSGGGTSGDVTLNLADASTSVKGASSFSSDNFAASSGLITIKDLGIATAEIQDDAITLAKMAPGTDGNIISYDASGNPVAVATGSAGQILTSAGAGAPPTFATAASANNTPLIQVSLQSAAQTITDSSQTKIAYNAIQQNVGGTWDASNYRWTPGTAGKYFITASTMISADANSDLSNVYTVIKMNGTIEFYLGTHNNLVQGYGRGHQSTGSVIKTMDDNDYIECFAFLNTVSGNNGRLDGESKQTWLTAYKIIT